MSVPVRSFLKHRRDRALGSILGYAEREIWGSLTPAQQEGMRRAVIDALTGYHDSVLDLVKADDDTSAFNLEVLSMLQQIERRTPRRPAPAGARLKPGAAGGDDPRAGSRVADG